MAPGIPLQYSQHVQAADHASPTSPKVVLYAEDNENDVLLMRMALKRVGSTVVLKTVSDGHEAISYLNGTGKYSDRSQYPCPNFVLLDVKMPRANGFDVLRWIRNESPVRQVPVVMFSASLEKGDRDKSFSLGANSFLIKPSRVEELFGMAETVTRYWLEFNCPSHIEVPAADPCLNPSIPQS